MSAWYPAEHTYLDGRLVAPHYATMPSFFRLYDTAVLTSGWRRWQKKLWRKALSAAATRWGYTFSVVEVKDAAAYRVQGITVRPFVPDPDYGKSNYGGFGLAPIDHPEQWEYDEVAWGLGKGAVLIYPTEVASAFTSRTTGRLAGVMCHEIGHALGFGHGGTGIMMSAMEPPYYPNEEELSALVAYWGIA